MRPSSPAAAQLSTAAFRHHHVPRSHDPARSSFATRLIPASRTRACRPQPLRKSAGMALAMKAPGAARLTTNGEAQMKPRITVFTVRVDDLERALRFYRDGLGLRTEGIIGKEFE